MATEVEFLWWSECPSWERALADLKAAMVENGLDPGSIVEREIESDEQAEAEGFPGSPTIRVNGADIAEPAEGMPRDWSAASTCGGTAGSRPCRTPSMSARRSRRRSAIDCSHVY